MRMTVEGVEECFNGSTPATPICKYLIRFTSILLPQFVVFTCSIILAPFAIAHSTLTSEFNALRFIHDSQEGWMLVAFTYNGCGRYGYISIIIAAVVAIICISVSIVDNVIMMMMVMVAITIDVIATAVDAIVVHWRRWHCRFHGDNIPIHFVVFILIWIIKFIGIQFRCRSNRIAIFIVAIAQNFLLYAVPVWDVCR